MLPERSRALPERSRPLPDAPVALPSGSAAPVRERDGNEALPDRSRRAPGAGSGLHLSGAPLHTVGTATWSSDRETGRALPDDGSRPGAAAGSGDYLAERRKAPSARA